MKYTVSVELSVGDASRLSTCSFELWERDWLEPPENSQLMSWDCNTDADATSSDLQRAREAAVAECDQIAASLNVAHSPATEAEDDTRAVGPADRPSLVEDAAALTRSFFAVPSDDRAGELRRTFTNHIFKEISDHKALCVDLTFPSSTSAATARPGEDDYEITARAGI